MRELCLQKNIYLGYLYFWFETETSGGDRNF
jgi:hypothetical protein